MCESVPPVSTPRIWDLLEEEERDIGRQWHRAQILARIFGRWVGWYLEWQRIQDEVEIDTIEPFKRKKINKLQRKWFVKCKNMVSNRINMTTTVRLAKEFRILHLYQGATKRLMLYSRNIAPKESKKYDLTHKSYYYRVFLQKLLKKYDKKYNNYYKLRGNLPPDTLRNSFYALKGHVRRQQATHKQHGMLQRYRRNYRMNRVYYKIIHRIKTKLYYRINHGNYVKILENYKEQVVMSKLYAHSRRQSCVDYRKGVARHNTYIQRKGLLSLKLKLLTPKDRESDSLRQYYDDIFRKNQSKNFILHLIRLQHRRLLQCESEYRTEQNFNCNWKFRRFGNGVDIWRNRLRILQCQGYCMDSSLRHYKIVIKRKALNRWQRFGRHIAKRSLRCRVIAQFHHDMKLMTKYIQQFCKRKDEVQCQRQVTVKSIWFWRAFRGIKAIRTWRSFVDIERAARAVSIDNNKLNGVIQEGSNLWHASLMLNGTMTRAVEQRQAAAVYVPVPRLPVVIRVYTGDSSDKSNEYSNIDVIRALARAPPRTVIPDFLQSSRSTTTNSHSHVVIPVKTDENKRIHGEKDINKLLIARDIIQFVSEMQKELRFPIQIV